MRKKVFLAYKSSNISETRQDRTNVTFVTIEEEEVQCALSIVPKSTTLDGIIGHRSIFDVGTITIPVCLLLLHFPLEMQFRVS